MRHLNANGLLEERPLNVKKRKVRLLINFPSTINLQYDSHLELIHGVCGLFRLLPDSLNLLIYLGNLFSVSPSLVVWDHGGELVNLLLVLPVVL